MVSVESGNFKDFRFQRNHTKFERSQDFVEDFKDNIQNFKLVSDPLVYVSVGNACYGVLVVMAICTLLTIS